MKLYIAATFPKAIIVVLNRPRSCGPRTKNLALAEKLTGRTRHRLRSAWSPQPMASASKAITSSNARLLPSISKEDVALKSVRYNTSHFLPLRGSLHRLGLGKFVDTGKWVEE